MATQYWLLKSEPGTYSIDHLKKDKKTNWDHIRNYQARNFLRKMKKGDLALIYHSNEDRAVVGVSKCIKEAYVDPDPEGGDWSQVDLGFVEKFKFPVTLATLKASPKFGDLLLIKQSRLSAMPVSKKHFDDILKMGSMK